MPEHSQQLPLWVSILQALAIPIIAVVGTWIALQQMRIARIKVQHDTFDRRFAVYEATRNLLAKVFQYELTENEIREYGLRTLDAKFLFNNEMYKYLREIAQRVTNWNYARTQLFLSSNGEDKAEYKKIESDNLEWIIQQGDEAAGFSKKFEPFLVDKIRRMEPGKSAH